MRQPDRRRLVEDLGELLVVAVFSFAWVYTLWGLLLW